MTDAATPLSDAQYQQQADAVLSAIEQQLDAWLQDDVIDIDGRRSGGLLDMALPGGTSLVVNMQPPLQELWLAARAGGHHYRWVNGRWLDTRDGSEFFDALSRHATAQAGMSLRFHAPVL